MSNRPPNFWAAFAEALRISATRRSILAFIPWWLLVCCLVPVAVIHISAPYTNEQISGANAVTVLSAIAVVAGFLGSVSIATIGQVQRMVSEYPFSGYLRDEGLFDQFLFWPQFTLLLQIGLLLVSTISAVTMRIINLDDWNKYVLAVDIGLLFYVCSKTWNLIDLVRKLTWHYEDYNRTLKEHQAERLQKQK